MPFNSTDFFFLNCANETVTLNSNWFTVPGWVNTKYNFPQENFLASCEVPKQKKNVVGHFDSTGVNKLFLTRCNND